MSEFGNAVLTSAGLALLNKAVSGEARLEFTRMALGDGTYTEEQKTPAALQTLTALRSERGSYDISTKSTVNATTVKLTALLTNWDKETGEALITEGFHQNEIGLFCKAVGDDTSEVLYSVAVADGEGTIMPAFTGRNPTQIRQSFVVSVDSSNNITITIHPGFTVDENLDETSTNPVQNKTVATEIKAIKNMQIPSEEGAFGVRYWNKKWQVKGKDGTYENAAGGGIAPDPVKSIKAVGSNGQIKLYLDEPGDTIIDGHTLVKVDGVIVMRKDTEYPATEAAGIQVFDIKRADFGKYKSTPYIDDGLTNGKTYYYTAFPYSTDGVINYDDKNHAKATPKEYQLYGYDEDQSDPNPQTRISYPDDVDNAGFTPISVDTTNGGYSAPDWKDTFIFKGVRPVMLKFDGTVDYELNHDDQTKKLDGTASDVSNQSYEGDAMVEFKKMYFRRWTDDNNVKHVRVSDKQVDQNFHCYQHMNGPDSEIDNIYLPMFEGSVINGKMRSIAGVAPTSDTTGTQEISYCAAKGAGHQLDDWANTMMVENLLFLIGKSTDVQKTYGNGHYSGGSSASSLLQTGTLKNKGMFWGSTGNVAVKVFWLENYFGDRWDRKYGCVTDANGQVLVKMFPPYNTDGSGYTATGVTPTGTSGGYISKTKLGDFGDIPTEVNGSETTNIPDGCWFAAGCFLVWGGACNHGLHVGVAFDVDAAVSYSHWNLGGSPAYKSPLAA